MKIPNKIMLLKEHGDIMSIVGLTNISRPTITKALKTGSCSRKTYHAIMTFYNNFKTK